jgi:predicted nuclease with TOPRIM domain
MPNHENCQRSCPEGTDLISEESHILGLSTIQVYEEVKEAINLFPIRLQHMLEEQSRRLHTSHVAQMERLGEDLKEVRERLQHLTSTDAKTTGVLRFQEQVDWYKSEIRRLEIRNEELSSSLEDRTRLVETLKHTKSQQEKDIQSINQMTWDMHTVQNRKQKPESVVHPQSPEEPSSDKESQNHAAVRERTDEKFDSIRLKILLFKVIGASSDPERAFSLFETLFGVDEGTFTLN